LDRRQEAECVTFMYVKRLLLAALLLLGSLAAAYAYSATSRERTYRQLIEQGEAALRRDDTFSAIEAFSGAILLKHDSMLGYLKRGEAYRRRGELEAARRDLRRAAEVDPAAPRPLELLGDVNYADFRYERAAENYQQYVRLDDRSPRIFYKLGLALYGGGHLTEAVTALRQAIALDDRFAEAYYVLGLCLRDSQKLKESLASLKRSIELAPAMIHAREELAELYGRLGRVDDRLNQLEALLALDPGPSREVSLGLAYASAGQEDRAVLTLGRAAERYPDHAYTYVALGRVWLERAQTRHERADLSKALGALEGAVGSDDSSEALMLFGRALLLTGDDKLAEHMLQQATEKLPAEPLAFYYLAEAAEHRGDADVARRALLDYQALEGEQQNQRRRARLAERIADLSMRMNEVPTAIGWYRRAADAAPGDPDVLVRLAGAQAKAGDRDGARAIVAEVLEKDPVNRAALALQRRLR
jgi:tetratricopeptide (TPR) repeat protein